MCQRALHIHHTPLSQNSPVTHLKTSIRPSSEAQAMELEPWQKTNAFIFQPAQQTTHIY